MILPFALWNATTEPTSPSSQATNPEASFKLSQKRAENTMQELVKLGADAKRLETKGYGEKFPVANNSTEEGGQMNQRIDLRVTSK